MKMTEDEYLDYWLDKCRKERYLSYIDSFLPKEACDLFEKRLKEASEERIKEMSKEGYCKCELCDGAGLICQRKEERKGIIMFSVGKCVCGTGGVLWIDKMMGRAYKKELKGFLEGLQKESSWNTWSTSYENR